MFHVEIKTKIKLCKSRNGENGDMHVNVQDGWKKNFLSSYQTQYDNYRRTCVAGSKLCRN
jgi:hypothetical protein